MADVRRTEVLEDVIGVVRLEGGGEVVGKRDLLVVSIPTPATATALPFFFIKMLKCPTYITRWLFFVKIAHRVM